jgi:hypothetical protein
MKTNFFTKKFIAEYIATDDKEALQNIWKDMKKLGIAGKYCSQERIRNFWNYFQFVISENIFDNWKMDWEFFHFSK